jgi:hypothetical protein
MFCKRFVMSGKFGLQKKEDSVSCWYKAHQPRQGQRPLSCTNLCPCQAGEICRNSNTQMSRNKSIDGDDVDLMENNSMEPECMILKY